MDGQRNNFSGRFSESPNITPVQIQVSADIYQYQIQEQPVQNAYFHQQIPGVADIHPYQTPAEQSLPNVYFRQEFLQSRMQEISQNGTLRPSKAELQKIYREKKRLKDQKIPLSNAERQRKYKEKKKQLEMINEIRTLHNTPSQFINNESQKEMLNTNQHENFETHYTQKKPKLNTNVTNPAEKIFVQHYIHSGEEQNENQLQEILECDTNSDEEKNDYHNSPLIYCKLPLILTGDFNVDFGSDRGTTLISFLESKFD